jgi:hypothetical protein
MTVDEDFCRRNLQYFTDLRKSLELCDEMEEDEEYGSYLDAPEE